MGLWLCLVGCGSAYEGDLLVDGVGHLEPNVRRVGCIDVRVAALIDGAADPSSPVVAYDFGNRCDGMAVVDLARVRVLAGYADRPGSVLRPFDPEGVIEPGLLDAGVAGREVIAYLSPPGELEPPAWFCVDVTQLSDGAGALAQVCFDRNQEQARWRVRS